jgi:uncharacterized membrane protein YdjX (TVP38/TMEM64 family)
MQRFWWLRRDAGLRVGVIAMPQLMRLSLLAAALVTAIVVPFVIWGGALDSWAPELLQQQDTRLYIAALGAALLIADVLLPVPSSVVSALLCVLLGPLQGAVVILFGMVGGFIAGYLLGLALPSATLRNWVGAALWDSVADKAQQQGTAWIVISRPVPVLAEAISIIAGSLRLPWRAALVSAVLSSAGVAACYGAAAAAGFANGSFWLAFGVSIFLACAAWFVSHFMRLSMARRG